ncbi:MAG: riboflavin synthase [Dehalococcoidales bacterium]|nr:riboflavin synthase [Dehalococcoidales bacterium]
MFTGIIQEVGTIVSIPAGKLVITGRQVMDGLVLGASVAVNGVCLTATAVDAASFTVDTVPETLQRSNLGQLRTGSRVNLERALKLGGELGGHLVQGHIDDTGTVVSKRQDGPAVIMRFKAPPDVLKYVVGKGFIAVDGTSLTVVDKDSSSFSVSVIPLTQTLTILLDKNVGDAVNLEVDIIGKYVAELMNPQSAGLTAAFLQENGFPVT